MSGCCWFRLLALPAAWRGTVTYCWTCATLLRLRDGEWTAAR